jgi:hypothetical protein
MPAINQTIDIADIADILNTDDDAEFLARCLQEVKPTLCQLLPETTPELRFVIKKDAIRLANSSAIWSALVNERYAEIEPLEISCSKVSGYRDFRELCEFICGEKINVMSMKIRHIVAIAMWLSVHNASSSLATVSTYGTQDDLIVCWRFLLKYILIKDRCWKSADQIEKIKKGLNKAYFYIIYVGIHNIEGEWTPLIKIGKSNRTKDIFGRLKTHLADAGFSDFKIISVLSCLNETNIENTAKSVAADYLINWSGKKEIYQADAIFDMCGAVDNYINDATEENEDSDTEEDQSESENRYKKQNKELLKIIEEQRKQLEKCYSIIESMKK